MSEDEPKIERRIDAYANFISQLGTTRDKSTWSTFQPESPTPWAVLDAMYEQDQMVARIVDRLPDDGTREGFNVETAEDFDVASLRSEMEDLDVLGQISDAWRWSRLYGGALLVMVVDDGLPMEEPIDLEHATKLVALNVVESPFVTVEPTAFSAHLGSQAFRRPNRYMLTGAAAAMDAKSIHHTRVIRFEGVRVPSNRLVRRNGWPPSIIDRVKRAVVQLGSAMGYAENIMHDLSVLLLKIKDLRNKLVGSEEDKQEARAIVESIRYNSDNLHTIALDSEDDLIEMNRTVTGITDLLDRFVDGLVRATDMPRTVLLGEQPGGLNANADSEIRAWYDFVASQQKIVLTPALTRLIGVIFRLRQNRGEQIPDEWTIEYNPLWQPSQKEEAETLETMAKALDLLVTAGLIDTDEGRAKLLSSGLISGLEAPNGEP